MCPNLVYNKIKFEIKQIDNLLVQYEDIIKKSEEKEPDLIELTALASVLHSFYNGIENIFVIISKNIDEKRPTGSNWHKTLLLQMNNKNNNRQAIISNELKEILEPYLGFRHFYRHSYSFYLDWEEMKELVIEIFEVWKRIKTSLNLYMD